MKVFVIHRAALDYDQDGRPTSTVTGVYTTWAAAELMRLAQGGTITTITMDYLPESYKKWLDKVPS